MWFFRNKFILHGSAFIKSERIVSIIHVKRAEEPLMMLKLIPRKNITINGLKFTRDQQYLPFLRDPLWSLLLRALRLVPIKTSV